MTELDREDEKIITLARAALGRTGGSAGAAVRDTDGRTYVAGTVELASLRLTALQAAVAAAVSSGAEGLEAAAVVSERGEIDADSVSAVRDMGAAAPVYLADRSGALIGTL